MAGTGGKPWSNTDIAGLENGMDRGVPIDDIAPVLRRDVDEVRRAPLHALQLLPHP
jgi:hypothetical protein